MDSQRTGKLGEQLAENFLTSQNYEIVSRNYRSRFGEIDLIAFDYSEALPQLVFVEVKTRTKDWYGEPEESVNRRKINKILKTAMHYLKNIKSPLSWRIDVIAIKLTEQSRFKEIKQYKNILDGS